MEPTQDTGGKFHANLTKAIYLIIGVLVGYCVMAAYFLFLVPKPIPVVVEKIVEKIVPATTTPVIKSQAVPRVYTFRTLKILDDKGATTTLSAEDAAIVDKVSSVLKKDKDVSSYIKSINQLIISSGNVFVKVRLPDNVGGEEYGFVVDINTPKMLDKFLLKEYYYLDKGTFVLFDYTTSGFSYYMYGASTSVMLPNSTLFGNQSYTAFVGEGASGFQIIATSTDSITFGVFDKTQGATTTGSNITRYKKVGERMFVIP